MKEEKFESIQTKIVEPIFRFVHDAVNFRLLREENKIDTYFYSMLGKSGRHFYFHCAKPSPVHTWQIMDIDLNFKYLCNFIG